MSEPVSGEGAQVFASNFASLPDVALFVGGSSYSGGMDNEDDDGEW